MRTTNDKKDRDLRIRLNEAMYRHLVEMSSRKGESVSNYIRDLIEKDMLDKGDFEKNFKQKIPEWRRNGTVNHQD